MLPCLEMRTQPVWLEPRVMPIAAITWLDTWVDEVLGPLSAALALQAGTPLLEPVEDPHRASALWRWLRPFLQGVDTQLFPRGIHPVVTVAQTHPQALLSLRTPTSSQPNAPWLVLVCLGGGRSPTAHIELDGEQRDAGASPGDVLVVPRSACITLHSDVHPSRWIALLVLTGRAIAL